MPLGINLLKNRYGSLSTSRAHCAEIGSTERYKRQTFELWFCVRIFGSLSTETSRVTAYFMFEGLEGSQRYGKIAASSIHYCESRNG